MSPDDGDAPAAVARPVGVSTMRDIAAAAGVSQSTVSRVLNNVPTRVPSRPRPGSASWRRRSASATGPIPSPAGSAAHRRCCIGAVVRDITDPFFAGAIESLSVEAMARGYNVVLGHAHSRADEASR